MRKITLRQNSLFITCFVFFLISTTSCSLIFDEDFGRHKGNGNKNLKNEVDALMEEFASTEENKDAEGHRKLFLSGSSRLNFLLKNYGSPYLVSLSREEWIGFFTSWDYDYYPVYSDIEYYFGNAMAVDKHLFQGFKNNDPDISGVDLFMYIKTPDGLKLVNVSSIILNPDDQFDYESLDPIATSPEVALSSFIEGTNNKDQGKFESAFHSNAVPCFRFKNTFNEEYDDSKHSSSAFFNTIPEELNGLKINLSHLRVDISDKWAAVAKSDYSIKSGGKVVETGEMLATIVATREGGWKITGLMLSVSHQLGK